MVRASSHVLYLFSVVTNTEHKQVYGGKQGFVSERTIKDIIIIKTKGDPEKPYLELQDALSKQLPPEIYHKMLPASEQDYCAATDFEDDAHGRRKGKCGCAGEARSSSPTAEGFLTS